ncbi:hypothetical protein [Niabella hibiscisoli]|nr:hypothetical protein [Niabella hibiscisoli]
MAITRNQEEELKALQDTLYFIGANGAYLLSTHYAMATGVFAK